MKKAILTLALVFSALVSTHAAKAWPFPITVIQSNGTPITVYLHGDEHLSWYTDTQGRILKRTGNDFTVVSTDADTYLSQARATALTRAINREPIAPAANLFPHTGSPRAVVILAQYSDLKFALPNPRASFNQYLNSLDEHPVNLGNREDLNYASVKKYFIAQSDGAYSPQFDLYGPVTLPNTMAYYGGTDDQGHDERYTQLIKDACTAMNDSLDFSQYDQDGDGNIDLVYVIYAGYGQSNGAPNNTMWPKSFPGFSDVKFDGKGVNRAGISNELNAYEGYYGYNTTATDPTPSAANAKKYINGIGLFIHEFSHCLGLPDFYPTTLTSVYDNQGMEDWSIMDNGTYVSNGNVPVSYTAWEREAMGWDNIKPISEAGQYSLTNTKGQRAVKVVNPTNANEYFVMEIYEDKGWNQRVATYTSTKDNISYNPTTRGLLIYHVDYSSAAFNLNANNVNNTAGHPRLTAIPADGKLLTSYRIGKEATRYEYAQQLNGDIFRVDDTVNAPSFSQTGGLPNAAWWTASAETPIYNINYLNGTVYFDFLTSVATTDISRPNTDTVSTDAEKIYTVDGRYVGTDASVLPRGIYIRGGKKFVK